METEFFSKPSIIRLARRSGVKSISDDCVEPIQEIIYSKLDEIIRVTTLINKNNNTKTILPADLYQAFNLLGYNIAKYEKIN